MSPFSPRWLFFGLAGLWVALILYIWSPRYYWPDADGYLLHVAEGRWVAHPPGYPLFVLVGRLFHFLGCAPYLSVQLASVSLTIAGVFVLFRLMRTLLAPSRALAFVAAAAFSWVVLLTVQTGTSHSSDLFTVSLLLLAAVRLPESKLPAWNCNLFFAAALFICAGFRLTTLFMMMPLCVMVAWSNRQRPSFWISCLVAAGAIAVLQLWVVAQSGGYAAYVDSSAGMNADNKHSSVFFSGITQTTMLNVFRAFLWAGLGILPFLAVIVSRARGPISAASVRALVYGLAAAVGPLLGVVLYLCTHPGYVVSVVPGTALVAAALTPDAPMTFPRKTFIAAALGTVCMFLLAAPWMPPANKWQALANGIFLQYSAGCARTATFNTTARWLRLAGLESEIPTHRVIDLQQEDEWREYFHGIDPARR